MLLKLAEIEHRLSSAPPYPTKGCVWRTLVAAFWRGDLRAASWTREQLREIANLNSLPFERIATQMAGRTAYSQHFRQHYLDELLFDFAEAERCVLGERADANQTRGALAPGSANIPQQRVSTDELLRFLLSYADGMKKEEDCRSAAKTHFAPRTVPDKKVWRPTWAKVPANQKLPRGKKPSA